MYEHKQILFTCFEERPIFPCQKLTSCEFFTMVMMTARIIIFHGSFLPYDILVFNARCEEVFINSSYKFHIEIKIRKESDHKHTQSPTIASILKQLYLISTYYGI